MVGQHRAQLGQSDELLTMSTIRSYRVAGGDVIAFVVHDVISAQRADEVDLRRTADPGDGGTHGLGDLDGERADATGGPDDQYTLACFDSADVADRLERCQAGHWDSCCLIEAQVRRYSCQLALLRRSELGERSLADAEHVVAHTESGDGLTDGDDPACASPAWNRVSGPRSPNARRMA